MVALNPYVLVVMILASAGYMTYEKVKEPVKHALVKTGHGIKHVITLGHK